MSKQPSSSPRSGSLDQPYVPGDAIPAPEASEQNSDSAWDLFSSLAAKQNGVYADTAPASVPGPLPPAGPQPKGDRRYAKTEPAPLRATPAAPIGNTAPAAKRASIAEVMAEARRNNRMCPQPVQWQQLYELLPDKKEGPRGWEPPQPLGGAAWAATPALAKRMCLRDHIEWADAHGALDAVHAFLKNLTEEQWHHLGD
ncbi:MAG: hypothetical protein JWQ07_2337 [Ramlibacter sp.]|nr:hypothetical protein [Ramlibacter sp.]